MKRQDIPTIEQTIIHTSCELIEQPVHRIFENHVARNPDQLAVIYPSRPVTEQLTYLELNRRANLLAHHLQSLGVGPDTLVGLFVEPSVELIIGMLAI